MNLLITDVTVGDRPGRAVAVTDGRIAWLGDAADAPDARRVIAGEGALLTPAFVDARSGRLDAVRPMPWYMGALLLAQPLHFGDYAGLPMKLLWAVLDILTIIVLVTGLRLWLRRATLPTRARVHELLRAGEPADAPAAA